MSLNKVMLIGNVGREPEVRYVDAGVATAVVSLATTTRGYRLQSGTEVPERTEWHRIILWRKLAEVVERYVHKGDKLYVEGEIRTREWTDKKGHAHTVTEIWANNLELLSPRPVAQPNDSTQPNPLQSNSSQPNPLQSNPSQSNLSQPNAGFSPSNPSNFSQSSASTPSSAGFLHSNDSFLPSNS